MKAILTGHSRGLGAAIAENLLARGIPVLALSRNKNSDLETRYPSALQQVELDLADLAALQRWLAGDALQHFLSASQTALLINNAGVVQPVGPLDAQDTGAIARAVSLNVTAPLMLAGAVAAAGSNTKAGAKTGQFEKRILHISSGAGRSPYPGWSIYCATKAALDHHARAVMLDQAPNLRICSLAPGVIDTDMQAEIRGVSLEQFPLRERFEALKREGNLAAPEACARQLVDFLLSEQFGRSPVADLRETGG